MIERYLLPIQDVRSRRSLAVQVQERGIRNHTVRDAKGRVVALEEELGRLDWHCHMYSVHLNQYLLLHFSYRGLCSVRPIAP